MPDPVTLPDDSTESGENQIVDALFTTLGSPTPDPLEGLEPAPELGSAPDPKPPAAAAPAATPQDPPKPADAPPAPPPVKVVKKAKVFPVPPPPAAAAPAPATPAPAPAAPDLTGLSEDQVEEIELARWAEKNEPDKYQGRSEQLLQGFKALEAYVAKRNADGDPVEDPENDRGFKDLTAKLPKFSRSEVRRLTEGRILEQAEERAFKRSQGEIEKARLEARLARVEPAIEGTTAKVSAEVESEVKSDDPFSEEVVVEAKETATAYVTDYLRIYHGVQSPSESPHYQQLLTFVEQQAATFKAAGKDLERDGRNFATPLELIKMTRDQRAKHWTFGPSEIVPRIKAAVVDSSKRRIQAERERFEKYASKGGYTKSAAAPAAAKPPETKSPTPHKPMAPPPGVTSVAPGAVVPGKEVTPGSEDSMVSSTLFDTAPKTT